MKQHITVEQLHELSTDGDIKLEDWCYKHEYFGYHISDMGDVVGGQYPPLLSIGQMIEFLDEQYDWNFRLGQSYGGKQMDKGWMVQILDDKHEKPYFETELCDALWEATEEVLER